MILRWLPPGNGNDGLLTGRIPLFLGATVKGNFFDAYDVAIGGATVDDDAALIAQTLDGQRAAFEQLVRKYQSRLINTLWHLVGSREEAEDVSQEALVQAFLKLESFGGRSAFFTWLYRIGFNLAVSRQRRKRSEISRDQHPGGLGPEPCDRDGGPEERLLRDERIGQIREALQTLNQEHRAILILREMEGCCYETIAEILDLPVGTVRSRLHRARMQLREQLMTLWKTDDITLPGRTD